MFVYIYIYTVLGQSKYIGSSGGASRWCTTFGAIVEHRGANVCTSKYVGDNIWGKAYSCALSSVSSLSGRIS